MNTCMFAHARKHLWPKAAPTLHQEQKNSDDIEEDREVITGTQINAHAHMDTHAHTHTHTCGLFAALIEALKRNTTLKQLRLESNKFALALTPSASPSPLTPPVPAASASPPPSGLSRS